MQNGVRAAGMPALLALFCLAAPAWGQNEVPKTLIAYTENVLAPYAGTAPITRYIAAQNAQKASVEKLKALDARWKASPNVEPYMWDLMRNALAFELVGFQYRNKFIVEAFAMNAQGAIVAETNRTSSFYKGEAAKFTAAYAGGAGALWYGVPEFDESTGEMVIQVSVPVMRDGKAIGAIVFGVSLDRWEQRETRE
jgi:hypothetical protein